MKRVLIVNTANTGYTGITSVIMSLVAATADRIEYDFVLCQRVDEEVKARLLSFGGEAFIPPYPRARDPLRYTAWLTKLIKRGGYDAVHVHGNSGTMFFDIHAARSAGVPVRIAHCHSSSCKHFLMHRLLKPLLNLEMTHGIACSDLADKWLFTKKNSVLYNGIDLERFAFSSSVREDCRRELGVESCFVIGHVGYMDVEKNHFFLLSAFAEAVKTRKDLRLILIGDGRLRSEIEEFIDKNHLSEKVVLLGKRGDVARLYQAMDLFVLPSVFEGLPVTLIEAQTAGLPCMASTSVTRQADLGGVGYLPIGEDSVKLWADAFEDVSASKNREEGILLTRGTDFDISVSAEKLLKLYGDIE